ncbi:hypothetical protein AQUCO_11900003v1 [Aquilegia coerulea]|uniref:F-box domain-containing protein n=1 Tax=Aquilegia coerulea TaxID=218851 RepID=A0A2G5C1Z0_AQUCA|nr:hypothetical protein AQUCO_11900003v1 [Aquilegia coerulea]
MKKRKLMSGNVAIDRISDLPDHIIIHHIFPYLDMKVIVQASILSNRWRYLWKSTPYLNFHLDQCPRSKKRIYKTRFSTFVDRVLSLRDCSDIHTFSLHCKEILETSRICTWLLVALRWNVENVFLDVDSSFNIGLPHNLFTLDNINRLKLRFWCSSGISKVILPTSICSNSMIKSLELKSVKLPKGNSDGELVFSFPLLGDLVIGSCIHSHLTTFTISAPLLESLELLHPFQAGFGPTNLHMCTPKLRSFIYRGPIYGNYSFENLSQLVSAEIDIWEKVLVVEKQVFDQCIANVLQGIYNVEKLTIPSGLVKAIAASPYMMALVPNVFRNLRYTKLIDWTGDLCIQTITTFLEKLPQIGTFVWSKSAKEEVEFYKQGTLIG